jgi:uncharacterized protein DUF4326
LSRKIGAARALELQPCEDPTSEQYGKHRWAVWGDDPRYQRCSRCGTISAEGISSEARYPRKRQPERPIRHHHQFEPCAFDRRYERCFCGASRRILTSDREKLVDGAQMQPTRVVHVRRDPFDIYIGRPMKRYPELHAEGWGNPVRPGPGVDAIAAYRDWLMRQPDLLARLPELRGKALGCWCAPKGGMTGDLYGHTCHGEVLAALADRLTPAREPAQTGGVV